MDSVYVRKEELNTWIGKYFNTELISIDDLIGCIEDLDGEVAELKMRIEELERDIEDNYRPISPAEQYGISEDDFI